MANSSTLRTEASRSDSLSFPQKSSCFVTWPRMVGGPLRPDRIVAPFDRRDQQDVRMTGVSETKEGNTHGISRSSPALILSRLEYVPFQSLNKSPRHP